MNKEREERFAKRRQQAQKAAEELAENLEDARVSEEGATGFPGYGRPRCEVVVGEKHTFEEAQEACPNKVEHSLDHPRFGLIVSVKWY